MSTKMRVSDESGEGTNTSPKFDLKPVSHGQKVLSSDSETPAGTSTYADDRSLTGDTGRSYYLSKNYIGSLTAIGLAGMAGMGGFSLIAPILSYVNADIGPDKNLVWVSLANNLTQAVTLTLAGRLSDLFGRRYFQICGTALALIGCIVGASAQNIRSLIGANVLVGVGSATQVSFPYLIAELVPMRHRYIASTYIWTLLIPVSGIASIVATSLTENTAGGWRSCYYFMITINAAALLCWVLFYYPPTWEELASNSVAGARDKWLMLRQMDFGGFFLLSAGLLLFLIGLSWGGDIYAWRSAEVLSTVVIGGVLLVAFIIYELRCPVSDVLVPMKLFTNIRWLAVVMTLSMAASMYYAFNIVFPTQVSVLYSSETPEKQGWLKCVIGAPPLLGQIIASLLVTRIGAIKWQLVAAASLGAALYGASACVTPSNQNTVVILLSLGGFALGWVDAICLTSLSVTLKDQRLIGTGVGVATSMRTVISTAAATIFTAILSNRLASTVPSVVPPALLKAGLPESSISKFVTLLSSSPDKLGSVSGANATIIEAGLVAFKDANAQAYSTVYLSTLAFSGLGVIFSFVTPKIETLLTDEVSVRLKT